MAALNIPAVSIALIDQDRIAFARAYGDGVTPDTLFQAASLSKFVAAVGAMRLVDQKRLSLDTDVNAALTSWKVPAYASHRDRRPGSAYQYSGGGYEIMEALMVDTLHAPFPQANGCACV